MRQRQRETERDRERQRETERDRERERECFCESDQSLVRVCCKAEIEVVSFFTQSTQKKKM